MLRNNDYALPQCIGETLPLKPKVLDTKTCSGLTFQWFEYPNFDPGATGPPIQGATDSIYYPPCDKAGDFFYVLKVTNSVGCVSRLGNRVYVAKNVSAGISFPTYICQNEKRVVKLRDYLIGEDTTKKSSWRCLNTILPKEIFDAKKGLVFTEKLAEGQYQFEYFVQFNNCNPDTSVVTLNIRPLITANAGTDKTLTCTDKILTIGTIQNPQNQYFSSWTNLNNLSTSFPNTDLLQVAKSGKYVLNIKDILAGCEAKDTVEVKDQRMSTDFSFSPISCNEQFGTAKAIITQNGIPPVSYTIDNQSVSNGNFEKIKEGNHRIIVSDAADCRDTFNFSLIKPLPLSIDFSPKDTTLESGDTLLLRLLSSLPNSKIKAMTWSENKQVIDKVLIFQKSIKPSQDVHYQVIAESIDGCKDTASALIKVIKSSDFFAPTAFSPNDDQNNDIFKIYPNPKKTVKIINFDIYDRWGNHILHQENKNPNDSDFGWDGTFKNELSPQGVYIWTAEIAFFDEKKKKISGNVQVF